MGGVHPVIFYQIRDRGRHKLRQVVLIGSLTGTYGDMSTCLSLYPGMHVLHTACQCSESLPNRNSAL